MAQSNDRVESDRSVLPLKERSALLARKLVGEIHEYRKTIKETLIQDYYTGEFDSHQSDFERVTTQNLLAVMAYSPKEASALFALLRYVIDKHDFGDFDDEKGNIFEWAVSSEDVTTKPNQLLNNTPTLNDILNRVTSVIKPAVVLTFGSIKKLLSA